MTSQRPQGALCSLQTLMLHSGGLGMSCWGEGRWSWVRVGPDQGQLSTLLVPFSLQLSKEEHNYRNYVRMSQLYLKSPQEPLRQEAVRFIGEPRAPGFLPLLGSPCPCTGAMGHQFSPSHPCLHRWGGSRLTSPLPYAAPQGQPFLGSCVARQAGWGGSPTVGSPMRCVPLGLIKWQTDDQKVQEYITESE